MEESIYKHNYEYLSIEEAKSIIGGTFVQGTTSIGGELATKADVDKLLTAADKKLTSIVPLTGASNEFICFFECEDIETFPDDLEHRWIEVSPIQFTFPADGGSVKITGSYGLTGTLGTRKKVGDITDTITADANATPSTKSGSKTYYYNNDQSQRPTAEVSWTQPNKEEEFPEEWTYVFEYNISDTNGGSSTGTSWSRQYYANGQEIKYDDDITLNGITSYRTKTGTFGTVKKENVQYSGQIGRPSGYNYSDKVITQNGRLAQQGSNKQLQWSYTQEANVKVWGISADPTSLHFEAAGGTQSVSVTTWYTWQSNDNNNQKFDQNTTTENITAEANTLQQQKTWTKVITKNNKSVSIQCTQEGAQEQFPDDLQRRWIRVQPKSSQISVDGGTINVTGSYGLTGTYGTEKKIGDITDTIVVESNSTQDQKSGSKTYYYNNNQSDTPTAKITWTQPGRAEKFPDDEAHRWIEITPTNAGNFTEAGGTITVTGSYGLTGSFGTKKTVGNINDTITVERNTTTQTKSGSKTYYYNNKPNTNPSATVTWTQDAHIESFTYTYEFKIGLSQDEITKDTLTLLFESTQYGEGSKVPVYYKSIKKKINESGQVVETTNVDIRKSEGTTNNSVVEINNGVIYVYPKAENSSLVDKRFDNYTFTNDNGNKCHIWFIQNVEGVKILSCDAVKFTYKWNNGTDLDQAVYVNVNHPDLNDNVYSGFGGRLPSKYGIDQFLKFAGDNTGRGNEYTFIEFDNLQKWINQHKDQQSSIPGKTILESLTDDNGLSSIKIDLYANWFRVIGDQTFIQYTLYNKNGDNQQIEIDTSKKDFILTGYQIQHSSLQPFACHSFGTELWYHPSPRKNYTKIGEFIVYLNSNKISFQSNVDDYNKWQPGVVLQYVTPSKIDYQYSMIDNNNKCNVTVNLKDFVCDKISDSDAFSLELQAAAIPINAEENINPYLYSIGIDFTKSVSKQEIPTSFQFEFSVDEFLQEAKRLNTLKEYTGQVYIYIGIKSKKSIWIQKSLVMNGEYFLSKGDYITRNI